MRSRGTSATEVFTAESVAENFGVTKSSYCGVKLPAATINQVRHMDSIANSIPVSQVQLEGIVKDVNNLCVSTANLAGDLEWGQVLIEMKYAAMNPSDFYTARTGGYGPDTVSFPHNCGHDGIGTVVKVIDCTCVANYLGTCEGWSRSHNII